jgi:UDP-N-acetyl-2-amino-2-deoxyglucuronate dehydrogenase
MQAIRDTGGELVASLDPSDSVGILDSYFPECRHFTEFERFDRYLEKRVRQNIGIDYLVVCSPNYLHDAHCRYGLRLGCDVICEKPLVLNPWNLDYLQLLEDETGFSVYTISQLRHHPEITNLYGDDSYHNVQIIYITPRGQWYRTSWKWDRAKSGGLITNIGVHLFDVMLYLYGPVVKSVIYNKSDIRASGKLLLENASITWQLSIKGSEPTRLFDIDGKRIELSSNFTELHTTSYAKIHDNLGISTEDARETINLISQMR